MRVKKRLFIIFSNEIELLQCSFHSVQNVFSIHQENKTNN